MEKMDEILWISEKWHDSIPVATGEFFMENFTWNLIREFTMLVYSIKHHDTC